MIEPLKVPSLKEACVSRLEKLVLSGELKVGERLPAERDLAASLNISRPVLHEALVDLAAKGLVSIVPRRGVYVNDYRTTGSLAMLSSLLAYNQGDLDPSLRAGLLDMRLLLEAETARLAALNRTPEQLKYFYQLLKEENQASRVDINALITLDFAFHQHVALSSGNWVYSLLLNSFQPVYTNISGQFFHANAGLPVIEEVFIFHQALVRAVDAHQADAASDIMSDMLRHGARLLPQTLA